jgi:parallel beta-helix repeat protein
MGGKKEDNVNVSDLTLRKLKGTGVWGYFSASMHLDNVSVENSGGHGVSVSGSKRNTMKNCNVSHSKWSGMCVSDVGLMTIDGNATTIHHNGTSGCDYGLYTGSSSSILLVSPLTKEMISTNNDGGRNCGVQYGGKIQTITKNNTKDEKK